MHVMGCVYLCLCVFCVFIKKCMCLRWRYTHLFLGFRSWCSGVFCVFDMGLSVCVREHARTYITLPQLYSSILVYVGMALLMCRHTCVSL